MKIKYDNHPEEWINILEDATRRRSAETWFLNDRLDSWRHNRMRQKIVPLIAERKNGKWLTVGDGRFGADAHFILAHGVQDVVATDISDELLKIGAQRKFINQYSVENAEFLSFDSGTFDYVYCKESYHHFPRPAVAIYEMLRVANEAVVLTEPNEQPIRGFSVMIKKLLGRSVSGHSFEAVGNYVYLLSEREVEKLMLGVGLRYCAFADLNDHYHEGIEEVPLRGGSFKDWSQRAKLKGAIAVKNFLCKLGLANPNFLIAILFKNKPSEALVKRLQVDGFRVKELPLNPYAN